jgi:GGDEF domain-containing protein
MISIRRFLERSGDAPRSSLPEASLHLRGLLLDGIAPRGHLRHEAGGPDFELDSNLLRLFEKATSPLQLLVIANQALEATQNEAKCVTEANDEQRRRMQSMVSMLTETITEISGQSDASVVLLQGIEQQIERASSLEDIGSLRDSLASCLTAVKEATVQQRKATLSAVERLRDHAQRAPQQADGSAAPVLADSGATRGQEEAEYVAAFKLQRAEHILTRFGEGARDQMLAAMDEGLKSVQGPNDRLMRWKGPAFVMFLSSPDTLFETRRRLSAAVVKIGQLHIELGKNSALLAVGVEWIVFPQARYSSLDLVFAEVDSFLGEKTGKP